MTRDDLERRVRARLSEGDTSYFASENVYDWLNEAPDALFERAPVVIPGVWSTPLLLGVEVYTLDTSALEAKETEIETTAGRITKMRYIEPDVMRVHKYGRVSPVNGTPVRVTYYTFSDGLALELDRASQNGGTLRVRGAKRANRLTAATDVTDVPEHLTNAVIAYCLMRAKEKDEESGQYDRARQEFEAECELVRARRAIVQADRYNQNRESWETVPGNAWPWWP